MQFIELTLPNGHPVLVNVDHIIFFTPIEGGQGLTGLRLTTGLEAIRETATEIRDMINPNPPTNPPASERDSDS